MRQKAPMRHNHAALAMFEPISWFSHYGPHHYIAHLNRELGRLGLDIYELSRGDSALVLSDLCSWLDHHRNEAEANLYHWRNLNIPVLLQRSSVCYTRVKPRIEVSAHITARDNLSVLWYPTGWLEHWDVESRNKSCDFSEFSSDGGSWGVRPSNEIMFIRGVGDLRPEHGLENYGPYLRHNKPVVDAILIYAVRAAYESLIERLQTTFEVTVQTVFVFENREAGLFDWSLEDPLILQRKKDQAEFAAIEKDYGFTVEVFAEQLRLARLPKQGSQEVPFDYHVNQKLARNLTKAGHKITPSVVERLRDLIRRCQTYPDDR